MITDQEAKEFWVYSELETKSPEELIERIWELMSEAERKIELDQVKQLLTEAQK